MAADVQQLLANGADPSARDYRKEVSEGYKGNTALHYACDWSEADRLTLVRMLLKAGANPSAASKYGHTPLHNFAIHNQVIEIRELLNAGASVNVFNKVGHTPLHNAARYSGLESVRILLDRGADPNAQKKSDHSLRDGYAPLHSAVTYVEGDIEDRLEVIRLLIRKGARLMKSQDGYRPGSPLQAAKDFSLLVKRGFNPNEDDRSRSAESIDRIISLLESKA